MDSAMGSPITQIGMPLAAGYAGSRGGAGGVNAALNTSQFLMRQQADKRVRDFFSEMPDYAEPGQNVTAAAAGATPAAASRLGTYMDSLRDLAAQGGIETMPSVVRGLTQTHRIATQYEEPKFDIDQGNILDTRTGEVSGIAPAQQAEQAETARYNTARISELFGREKLSGARAKTQETQQAFNLERVEKIKAEIEHEIGKGDMNKEGLSLQLDRVNEILESPSSDDFPEQKKGLIRLRGFLIERMEAIHRAEEGTKGGSTEEGTEMIGLPTGGSIDTAVGGAKVSPTGQVYDWVPGQGLRPR